MTRERRDFGSLLDARAQLKDRFCYAWRWFRSITEHDGHT
jgi:hypothetical protein